MKYICTNCWKSDDIRNLTFKCGEEEVIKNIYPFLAEQAELITELRHHRNCNQNLHFHCGNCDAEIQENTFFPKPNLCLSLEKVLQYKSISVVGVKNAGKSAFIDTFRNFFPNVGTHFCQEGVMTYFIQEISNDIWNEYEENNLLLSKNIFYILDAEVVVKDYVAAQGDNTFRAFPGPAVTPILDRLIEFYQSRGLLNTINLYIILNKVDVFLENPKIKSYLNDKSNPDFNFLQRKIKNLLKESDRAYILEEANNFASYQVFPWLSLTDSEYAVYNTKLISTIKS